jgi:hypothetical protein
MAVAKKAAAVSSLPLRTKKMTTAHPSSISLRRSAET